MASKVVGPLAASATILALDVAHVLVGDLILERRRDEDVAVEFQRRSRGGEILRAWEVE